MRVLLTARDKLKSQCMHSTKDQSLAHHSARDNGVERGRFVDVLANHEVGREDCHVIVAGRLLPSILLPHYPDTLGYLRFAIEVLRSVGDDELKALHST